MKTYYKNFLSDNGSIIPLGALGYAQRLTPILDKIKESPGVSRILDAGSGYGTESMLFGFLANKVIGVELVSERAEIARSRLPFFRAINRLPLNVEFVNANIFKYLKIPESFGIIWAMEAISHIYPLETFLDLAFERLTRGGKLIISDPNSINPLAWLRSVKIRGSLTHTTHKRFRDPETHAFVDYGQEKILPYTSLRQLLIDKGFEIETTQVSGFLCSSFLPESFRTNVEICRILTRFQRMLMKTPIIRSLGSIYTIVASKVI